MGDYARKEDVAGKGLAGTALGMGIGGVALALSQNGGLLNGLFGGGNNNLVNQLQAENSVLKAEKYSDKNAREVYMQALADNRSLRDELYAFIEPIAKKVADNQVDIATITESIKCNSEKQALREEILTGKINEVALVTKGNFDALNQTISCLREGIGRNTYRLDQLTDEKINASKVCPLPMPFFNSWKDPSETATKAAK